MPEFDVVGKNFPAIGSLEVVTGKAEYCPDLEFPGMLVGKLLYSQYASARILDIDVSAARAIPGVISVITADDIPGENSYLYWYPDQPLLAKERVRYQGDALAAVAAVDEETAQSALDAIKVAYEPLVGVFDPEQAMQLDAPRVWEEKANIQSHYIDEWGDIEQGFAKADVIVENTYSTHYEEHAMLETESAVAYLEADGTVVVFASAQAPHRDRIQIARSLGLPEAMVREITPHIGGAFGAKDEAHIQVHAAILAYLTGRPVKIVRSREESIRTHVKRHPSKIRYRTGATRDGKITAVHMTAIGDTGPYVNAGEEVMMVMANYGVSPYFVPNARSEAYTVLTNNPICGAFRGFGVPQVTFAFESQMDELARQLGMDPLEIRLLNRLETGQRFQPKAIVRKGDGMRACLEKAARLSNWEVRKEVDRQPEPHLRRGWGIAASFHKSGFGCDVTDHASAAVNMAPDGSVVLRTGGADMGQGLHTVLAQFVAEQFGISPDQVKVYRPDTTLAADAGASVASRATVFSGNAVLKATEPIRTTLLELAAEQTGADLDLLELGNGFVHVEGERVNITIANLAAKAYEQNLPMQSSGFYTMDYPKVQMEDGTEGYEQTTSFGAHVAQVLVDFETGQVEVERIVAVHDVGQVVNPGGLRGQVEGAVSMAAGYTFMEELLVEQGFTLNNSLESYLIPTSCDAIDIQVDVVELHDSEAPLGAKGIGEPPINITPAAIANAVSDAIGSPVRQLPISPERVLEAVGAGEEHGADAS
jgi:CO/xanthine dehydrogenase Mo-binding subunit